MTEQKMEVVMGKSSATFYATHLLSCVLQDERPEEKPQDVSWEEVFEICTRNDVACTAYPALVRLKKEGVKDLPTPQMLEKWQELYHVAILKEVTFDEEREKLLASFEKAGIAYMPLKGILLKAYYPSIGLRSFADNDILYDAAKIKEVKTIMEGMGYTTKSYGKGNHDVYQKLPMLNFELHRSLTGVTCAFKSYTDQAWDRAIKDRDNAFGYHMTKEDFYIYFIIHAHKHYSNLGTGIRTLLDQYLYLDREGRKLNWQYINQEFAKLGLNGFESELRGLGKLLFGERGMSELSARQEELLGYLASQGTYGTVSNGIRQMIQKKGKDGNLRKAKQRYVWERIFPKREVLQSENPILGKYAVLYPVMVVRRWFHVFFRWKRIKNEIEIVKKIDRL